MILHILMIAGGIGIIAFGFWGSFYAKRPWNIIASLSLPVGLVTAIIGVLLLCVPDFFKG